MKLKLILAACILFIVYSCQKEVSEPGITNRPVTGDSTILSQYIEFDTTRPKGMDTVYNIRFNYDDSKRNTTIDYIEYDSNGVQNRVFKSQFFYNGNDTVPSKSEETNLLLPSMVIDHYNGGSQTNYWFYDAGKLIKDSIVYHSSYNSDTRVETYTYSSNQILYNLINYDQVSNLETQNYFNSIFITVADENIIEQYDTIPSVNSNFTFLYDTHPNPFYRTQNKLTMGRNYPYYFMETYIDEIFTKNNAIEINQTVDNYNWGSFHYKNVYQYKANGYPAFAWVYDQNDPTFVGKAQYIYTN